MFYIHVERLLLLSGFIKIGTQGKAMPLQAGQALRVPEG
jgi:hypothetical protein